MKKALICSLAAMMLLCSFDLKSLFGGSKSSTTQTQTTTATTTTPAVSVNPDGKSAGSALRTLYTNYKAAGNKFDYSNLNNVISTLTLVNSCKNLKANSKDKTYWSGFAQGLVMGSENLVTDQISNVVTSQLSDLAEKIDTEKLESTTQKVSAVKSVASDVTNLLALFK